ncbi:hypothetical protein HDU93_007202 [Gonapodya sp. JEL0774]|nr:hypothetical protein HDU93_007202 [Gonapodya sp. JEL0774]
MAAETDFMRQSGPLPRRTVTKFTAQKDRMATSNTTGKSRSDASTSDTQDLPHQRCSAVVKIPDPDLPHCDSSQAQTPTPQSLLSQASQALSSVMPSSTTQGGTGGSAGVPTIERVPARTSAEKEQAQLQSSEDKFNKPASVSGVVTAAEGFYSARAELKPLMFEGFLAGGVAAGGQLTTTTEVENFPGFPTGISGSEITQKFREQSLHHGTEIRTETVSKVDLSKRPFKVWVDGTENDDSKAVLADSLIIATGATAKRGAAPIFRRKPLAVVGGGDTAAEEALFLTKYADKVFLLVRSGKMRASKVMRTRVEKHPKIEILYNYLPVQASGEKNLTTITIKSTADGSTRELPVNGLFYAIGHVPNTQVFGNQITLDETGYIVTKPGTTRTSVEGVFAAGDVQDFVYRQAITAAGTGCMAALEAERWLEATADAEEAVEAAL